MADKDYRLDQTQVAQFYVLKALRQFMERILKRYEKPITWKRPSLNECVEAIGVVAKAEAAFFGSLKRRWPELEGKDISVDNERVVDFRDSETTNGRQD